MAQLDTGTGSIKMIRARIGVSGIIQGVGFRPFIYRLATTQGITGYVANTAAGVTIEVDGLEHKLEHFIQAIHTEKPPLACIDAVHVEKSEIDPALLHNSFKIQGSISSGSRIGPITPDTDVCNNCLAELADPENRRYRCILPGIVRTWGSASLRSAVDHRGFFQ